MNLPMCPVRKWYIEEKCCMESQGKREKDGEDLGGDYLLCQKTNKRKTTTKRMLLQIFDFLLHIVLQYINVTEILVTTLTTGHNSLSYKPVATLL